MDYTLYAITDRQWLKDNMTLAMAVEEAIKGGATIIQLREKTLKGEALRKEALEVKKVCNRYNIPFIINDDVMLAHDIDADGVHVGQNDLDIIEARKVLSSDKIVGVTAKTIEQAQYAEAHGATYLGSGAVFGSSTKKDAISMNMETFNSIVASVNIPVVAIGGITKDNVPKLKGSLMSGIAVVSAVFAEEDIEEGTRKLKQIVVNTMQ